MSLYNAEIDQDSKALINFNGLLNLQTGDFLVESVRSRGSNPELAFAASTNQILDRDISDAHARLANYPVWPRNSSMHFLQPRARNAWVSLQPLSASRLLVSLAVVVSCWGEKERIVLGMVSSLLVTMHLVVMQCSLRKRSSNKIRCKSHSSLTGFTNVPHRREHISHETLLFRFLHSRSFLFRSNS